MRGRSVGLVVAAALAIGIGAGFWLGGRGTVTGQADCAVGRVCRSLGLTGESNAETPRENEG